MTDLERHSLHSVLREVILEHLLIGELLRVLWRRGITDAEILRSEFDAGGYDLVISRGIVTRHVQLKAMISGGKRSEVSINLNLAGKPSGCVVWLIVTDSLEFESFLWFGDEPGKPLPDVSSGRTTRHTKGDAEGIKSERPNLRDLTKSRFIPLETVEALLDRLLGDLAR